MNGRAALIFDLKCIYLGVRLGSNASTVAFIIMHSELIVYCDRGKAKAKTVSDWRACLCGYRHQK